VAPRAGFLAVGFQGGAPKSLAETTELAKTIRAGPLRPRVSRDPYAARPLLSTLKAAGRARNGSMVRTKQPA
jgi:hypothetical protein